MTRADFYLTMEMHGYKINGVNSYVMDGIFVVYSNGTCILLSSLGETTVHNEEDLIDALIMVELVLSPIAYFEGIGGLDTTNSLKN